jgi:hypothetical protein
MTLKRQIEAVGVLPGTVNNLLTVKRLRWLRYTYRWA